MNQLIFGDNLKALRTLPDESVDLIYIDPPFNTGKVQKRTTIKTVHDQNNGDRVGFSQRLYSTEKQGTMSYHDIFENDGFYAFLEHRLIELYRVLKPNGSLFFHIDYREAHYCKIMLDRLFGRASFINEIIWAYDYGARSRTKWPAKHDNIFFYAKNPDSYTFNFDAIDCIPYLAPDLVGKEKAERGKKLTDCYSEDTDILTDNGWIRFSELTLDHFVASVSPDGNLEYYKPSKLHSYQYQGDMIEFKSKTIDLCVTPNHNMYVKGKHSDYYEFLPANELSGQQYSLMNRFTWNSKVEGDKFNVPQTTYKKKGNAVILPEFDLGDWCEFMGLYLSEGNTTFYRNRTEVTISQIKKVNLEPIENLLTRMGMKFQQNSKGFTICNKQLADYFMQFGKSYEKYIPRNLLDLPVRFLERLYDGLMRGDGSKVGNRWTYFTTSSRLADQVQELIIKLGYNASISVSVSKNKNWRPKFCIYRKLSNESTIWPKRHKKVIPYNGMVYCCTVEPYHTLIVRRNGEVSLCGNCWFNTIVPTNSKEKTGYPTQKPMKIVERIVKVHSNQGDLVLDCFAGSGTLGEAAWKHGREFILIDQNPEAIAVIKRRLAASDLVYSEV